ncbi:MAG: hypothetical protein J6T39_00330, partial [Clostridia bacterium]|nr:hypothetical protein [Clostridia bacterium]
MKRILTFVLLTLLLVFSSFASPTQKAFAANISDNSVIILAGNINQQNKLVIDVNLTVNTGISAMNLELTYNKKVMRLSNMVQGSALSSLDLMTSNTDTEEGFAITPFIFNYFGEENDFSKGKLFTLTFELSNNISDGKYVVSLNYKRNADVNYLDDNGDLKTKNLLIDNAEIEIKDDSVIQIVSIRDDEQTPKYWIVILVASLMIASS